MADESVKVQMFRFVDVLPMLSTHEAVTRHLQEYFEEVRSHLPWAARLAVESPHANTIFGKALAYSARKSSRMMAERFIAGTKVDEVLKSVARLRRQGLAFTLDLLGEAVVSEPEADAYQQAYLNLITGLAPPVNAWPEDPQIDRDEAGWIPRCNVSLKLSALYSQFKPIDPEGTANVVKQRLRPILQAAREHDAFVNVDMEHYAYKDLTLEIFKQIFLEDEFRDWPDCGIVIQTYLPEAEADLQDLLEWTEQRGTPIWVRLVKGAYWDYETVVAEYRGWPCPVYTDKWRSDDNFERQDAIPDAAPRHAAARPRLTQSAQSGPHNGLGRRTQRPAKWMGNPNALRHGRGAGTALRRTRASRPRLHAIRRTDPRYGLPRPPPARKYVERLLPPPRLRHQRLD